MAFDKYYLTKNVTWYFLMWNRYFTVNLPRVKKKKNRSTPSVMVVQMSAGTGWVLPRSGMGCL